MLLVVVKMPGLLAGDVPRESHAQVSLPRDLFEQIKWVQGYMPWLGHSPSAYVRSVAETALRNDMRLIMDQLEMTVRPDMTTAEALDATRRRLQQHMDQKRL